MNKKNNFFALILILISFQGFAGSVEPNSKNASVSKQDTTKAKDLEIDVQKIIDEYKAYLAGVPEEVREEIVEFRKKVAEFNKQKRELYRKLSTKAQGYLKEEQKYKKRLPMDQKKLINNIQKDNN